MTTFNHGRYTLEWEHCGEGICGDWDPDDPNDKPLLRATLLVDGEPLNNGSYCTLIPDGTPDADLERLAALLFKDLPDDPACFSKFTMQQWTWNRV